MLLFYRHGRGNLTMANGFYYDGSWDRNYFDGRGHCIFPNGQEYQGIGPYALLLLLLLPILTLECCVMCQACLKMECAMVGGQ